MQVESIIAIIIREMRLILKTGCCLILLLLLLHSGNDISFGADNKASVEVSIFPNTLDVSIIAPDRVIKNKCFVAKVVVQNLGDEIINTVTATIYLDDSLDLIGKQVEKSIGTIRPHKKRITYWLIKPTKTGYHVFMVLAKGIVKNGEVSSEDSAVIKVMKRRGFFYRFFKWF